MSNLVVILVKHLLSCLLVDKCQIFAIYCCISFISELFSLIPSETYFIQRLQFQVFSSGDKTNSRKGQDDLPKLENILGENWNI